MKVLKTSTVLPGFNLSFGLTTFFLTLLVVLPCLMLFFTALKLDANQFWSLITDARVLASFRVSFGIALLAILVNIVFGTMVAWVLVRYDFFGKQIVNALIDLPFALPTAVAGIALATIYAGNGWIGSVFAEQGIIGKFFDADIRIAFTPIGIFIALVFVSLPFIVRTLQPVMEQLESEIEEAGQTLGANPIQIFFSLVMPQLLPALMAGTGMAFARATGEYGSVIFIAGNIPFVSEITPLLIVSKLEQFDKAGAAGVALLMLLISLMVLAVTNGLQWYFSRHN